MAKRPNATPKPPKTIYEHLADAHAGAEAALAAIAEAEKESQQLGPQFSPAHRAGVRNLRTALTAAEAQLKALARPPLTPPPA